MDPITPPLDPALDVSYPRPLKAGGGEGVITGKLRWLSELFRSLPWFIGNPSEIPLILSKIPPDTAFKKLSEYEKREKESKREYCS